MIIYLLILLAFPTHLAPTNAYQNNSNQLEIQFSPPSNIKNENLGRKNPSTYEYVIITSQELIPFFQPLINHKSSYINAKIVIKEEIVNNKSFWVNGSYGDATNASKGNPWIQNGNEVKTGFSLFNDTSAKIRNFIRFAHDTWNTSYVLLGGDHEIIPSRYFYGFISNWSAGRIVKSMEASIISDHYYAGLHGNWNDDCDSRFGEEENFSIRDEADFSVEIHIGRAPVNDQHDVNVFVEKVIKFETSEKPNNILLHHSYTNTQEIPDTSVVPEKCARWIPEHFNIFKLYEKDGMVSTDQWISAFQDPEKLIIYHVGNGYNDGLYSWYQLSWNGQDRERFTVLDVGKLNNSFPSIHLSISCLTGDFSENECIAEELLLSNLGGPSACIANSEVGCISKDNASRYSGEFFEQIIKEIVLEYSTNLGMAIYNTKQQFISKAQVNPFYRWCFYEINLLGDPETPCLAVRPIPNSNKNIVYVNRTYTSNTTGWNETRFSSIQSAVNAVEQFGIVNIQKGIYKEHIIVNKTLSIIGSNKFSTIIQNKDHIDTPLLSLQCHSSIVNNLTFQYDTTTDTSLESCISIFPEFNGNKIINNKIQNSSGYGILITNSIRNIIKENVIINNNCGVAIICLYQGLFPNSLIITCDNVISNNRISNNKEYGIYIDGSVNNFITKNTFLLNGEEKNQFTPFVLNNNLCLVRTKFNKIHGNYWDEPYQDRYQIWSLRGPITVFTLDFSRGILFKLYKCILILNIGCPYPVYDEAPAEYPILSL